MAFHQVAPPENDGFRGIPRIFEAYPIDIWIIYRINCLRYCVLQDNFVKFVTTILTHHLMRSGCYDEIHLEIPICSTKTYFGEQIYRIEHASKSQQR